MDHATMAALDRAMAAERALEEATKNNKKLVAVNEALVAINEELLNSNHELLRSLEILQKENAKLHALMQKVRVQ